MDSLFDSANESQIVDDVELNIGVTEDGVIMFGVGLTSTRILFSLASDEASELSDALKQAVFVAGEQGNVEQGVN